MKKQQMVNHLFITLFRSCWQLKPLTSTSSYMHFLKKLYIQTQLQTHRHFRTRLGWITVLTWESTGKNTDIKAIQFYSSFPVKPSDPLKVLTFTLKFTEENKLLHMLVLCFLHLHQYRLYLDHFMEEQISFLFKFYLTFILPR